MDKEISACFEIHTKMLESGNKVLVDHAHQSALSFV